MQYSLPKGYLSASAISCLLKCPKAFEFHYVKDIRFPQNYAMSLGSLTHKCFETYYGQVIDHGYRMKGSEVAEFANDVLIPDYYADNEVVATDKEKDGSRKIVPHIASSYVDNVGVNVEPRATEEEVRVTTLAGVPLLAYVDLRRAEDGSEGIVDYKITSRFWTHSKLKDSLQFNLYAYMTGIQDVEVHNIVKADPDRRSPVRKPAEEKPGEKTVTDEIKLVRHDFTGTNYDHFENLVERAAALITAGIFMPCSPDAWCCNATWCEYWNLCRGKKS